ncbi:MAG: hypothetical protein AB2669_21360 [Candidatus Thiodiazotropha endolucinida]
MATVNELRNKVLRKLKVLPKGQAAEAEDASIVKDAYLELYEQLTLEGIISYPDSSDIPTEVVIPLVVIVAANLVDEFELPSREARGIKMEVPGARRALRRQVVPQYQFSEPVKATYY